MLEKFKKNVFYVLLLLFCALSLDFLSEVRGLRRRYDAAMPVLVHCSAGVGRSGVVVLVDMLMAKVDCGDVSLIKNASVSSAV